MKSNELITLVNQQLANWNILYTKLHNYHWYVTGEKFFTLHEKFEEFYDEAATYIDEIAERMLAIQATPIATLKEYLDVATIEEANGKESTKEMVEAIINDFQTLTNDAEQIIAAAEESGDHGTADMFIGMKTSLEKHMWMLGAYLK